MSSIDTLKSNISSGLARSNRYRVLFHTNNEILDVLCDSVGWPGRQIFTSERLTDTKTRKVAYGFGQEDLPVSKCEECETSNEVDVDLQEVRVDIPQSDTKVIKLTDTIGVSLRYPSVDAMTRAQADESKSDIDRVFDLITACIDSIYSSDQIFDASEQTEQELRDFIESLNTKQFNEVREFIEGIPSAAINIKFKCTSCGHNNEFDVKGLGNFFG